MREVEHRPLAIEFSAPSVLTIEADDNGERRLLGGVAVPWGVVGHTSLGPVEFSEGALPDASAVPVVRGHNDDALIGAVKASSADNTGVNVRARLSRTPLADETLSLAEDGVLAGFSVSAVPVEYSMRADETHGQVMVVTKAEWRHLGVVQRPAYEAAQITTVAASHTNTQEVTVPDTATEVTEPVVTATAPDPTPPVEAAMPVVAVRSESFPYSFNGSGPSLLRDHILAAEGDRDAAVRIQRAQAMLRDPRLINAASTRMASRIDAATGTTVEQPAIVPPGYRPDLYTPLIAYEAPVYSNATKLPISDFTPFTIPREVARTGLSGTPADEVTPVAAGDIDTTLQTVTPGHVMGKYAFSRDLALSSNPAIDMIAMNAMDEEWLKDIEQRVIAFVKATPGQTHTAVSTTYADGAGAIKAARNVLAKFRTTRRAGASVIVARTSVWEAAVGADDASERPLLGWGQNTPNTVGSQSDGAQEASILGVPYLPEGSAALSINGSLTFRREDLIVFTTPVWNFRFEADGTNPLVITLVKYSGVAAWTRRVQGVVIDTNTTPIVFADEAAAPSGKGK